MDINLTVKHGELAEDVQNTIREKVSKLPRFFDRTSRIQVVADMKPSEPFVELIVSAEETNDFVASDSANNVVAALDKAISKIEKQLRKHKEKLKGHRGRDTKSIEPSLE